MRSWLCTGLLGLSCSVFAQQQTSAPPSPPSSGSSSSTPSSSTAPSGNSNSTKEQNAPSLAPPRSDRVQVDDLGPALGQSSSKDTQEDFSAPADDAATHPKSSSAVASTEAATSGGGSGITEFRVWDPHKAAKSVEVGDFYFRRKNYRAAEDRYREALTYKANDAVATFRLAICLEKLELPNDARQEYESYLKILPHGSEAEQARKAIERLKAQTAGATTP
jgi:Flp pilus assembly protein TadD